MSEVRLRAATAEDEPFIRQVFIEDRVPMFMSLPEPQRSQILDMQYRARQQGYASQFPNALSQIIESDGVPAGYLLTDEAEKDIHLVDICLLSSVRGKGVGTAVLKALIQRAKEAGKDITLLVEAPNPARRLYERLGFKAEDSPHTHIAMRR